MSQNLPHPRWVTAAILLGRLTFAGVFVNAVSFKLIGIGATAAYIATAGFPMANVLAWLAVLFEVAVIASLLTGAFFSEAALLAAAYVVFLGFAFHGPSHWIGSPVEFGFFIDHFTFMAGLLFAAAYGPGRVLATKTGRLSRAVRNGQGSTA